MQERIGADVEHDHLAVTGHAQVMHLLDRRLGLALPGAERTEIVGANQVLRGLGHALDVERAMVPGDFFVEMRRTDLIVVDHIAITPRDSFEARMEMRRHHPRPTDADVMRQIDVGAHDPGLQRTIDRRIKVHHLSAGMHARVGASGAL